MQVIEKPIEELKEYEGNPRSIPDTAINAVADSIREFGFRQPVVVDAEGVLVCGHTRILAARKLGLTKVPVHVAKDLSPEQIRALRIADNQTGTLADWDFELLPLEIAALQDLDYDLFHLGFDEETLAKYLEDAKGGGDEDAEVEATELESVKPEALSLIEECDRVVLQFSGGKDSTVALNWARGVCEKLGKPLECVFVETGSEFPDLTAHILRVCERLKVKLILLRPRQNILEYYYQRKQWPDSLYRDCLHKFINDPVNRHIRQYEGENVICVRGGRSDQKTGNSKSNVYQEVKDGERVVKLLNPFFGVDKDEYEKALADVKPLLWAGYDLGFVRTACWCCPFQKHEQWDCLKKHYPLLWEEMRLLAKKLEYKKYKGDNTRVRFQEYWDAQK